MSDRAAQLRTLATSFYREMMRLADEMDGGQVVDPKYRCCLLGSVSNGLHHHYTCPLAFARHQPAMDPAEDC